MYFLEDFSWKIVFLFGAYLCSIKDSLDSMTGRLTGVDLSEVPPGPRSHPNYSLRAFLPLGDWRVINVQVKKGKKKIDQPPPLPDLHPITNYINSNLGWSYLGADWKQQPRLIDNLIG